MDHFKPKGSRARWKPVYELLQNTNTNDVLTYDEIGKVLELDPLTDRMAIRSALYRAAKELEEVDKRAVTVVPNRGYRVAEPKEHVVLARKQHKRSTKALQRGHSKAVNVDMSKLDPEARKALEIVASAFAQQMDFNKRMERRLTERDQVLDSIVEKQERSEEQSSEVLQRLRELEAKMAQLNTNK